MQILKIDILNKTFKLVNIVSHNSFSTGYHDIGEIWREELEIPNLEKVVFDLYEQIKPLYNVLHAVVRHKLYLKYGPSKIDPKGPIPIHLLGATKFLL